MWGTCPNCGYCPTCGRSGCRPRPWRVPCVPVSPPPICPPYVVERTRIVYRQPSLGEFINALA